MKKKYVAMKNPHEEGSWCVCPKTFFLKNGHLISENADFEIDGMFEIEEHTFEAEGKKDPKKCLVKAGFEILEDPIWYWDVRFKQKKGKK